MVTTVQQIDENRISLRCHYAYRGRCHDIPGAVFDQAHKVWIVPIESLEHVKIAFHGEIYWKTPLWKIEGEFAPPKDAMSYLGPEPTVPSMELKPYSYQEEGIKFMIDRLNNVGFCLNGDGVGLGKTLEAIGTIKWFVENRGARKILIVCKKSLKTQWAGELKRITAWEDMPIFVTGGTTKKRKLAPYLGVQEEPKGILIANYQDFLNWKDEIDKVNFDVCVVDEAHCIKGRDGVMNKAIAGTLSGKRTILLTGTPIMSRPDDIWGIVHLAKPDFFGTYKEFKEKYIVEELNKRGYYWEVVGAKNLDELQEKLSRFLIMRSAEDVAIELPKIRPAKHISCDMDTLQLKMQGIVEDRKAKLEKRKQELVDTYGLNEQTRLELEKIGELSKMYIATLQFISDDPAVFRFMSPEKGLNKQLQKMLPASYEMSAKTEAAIDAVSELVDADEKVIVFCHFASTARMLKHHLSNIKGANPVVYTGAESDDAREANITAFKEDSECRVIIGTEAMAEGLNLQVSRHVIHFEQADTYAQREQRNGRIRRIGSRYDYVNVIDICSESDEVRSFDDVKIQKLRRDYITTAAVLSGAKN